MRKQTKIAAMVSAAALLTIGAAMTSFAAGWTMDGEDWVYTDKYGDRVTNEWKKSGNNWYYLGDDGLMVTSMLLTDTGSDDNIYYVNSGGAKVTNRWVAVNNEDGFILPGGEEPSTVYYYFDGAGRACKAGGGNAFAARKVKKNNDTTEQAYFLFDDQGHMMSGWVHNNPKDVEAGQEDLYYLGGEDEGWARTGWNYLEDEENVELDPYESSHWYWFNDLGKSQTEDSTRYIDGQYYHFGKGRYMDSGWFGNYASAPVGSPGAARTGMTRGSGRLATGWVKHAEDNSDNAYWYYLVNVRGSNGRIKATVPFNRNGEGKAKDDPYTYAARSINNKIYLFNYWGQMQTGLTTEMPGFEGAYVYNSSGNVMQDPNVSGADSKYELAAAPEAYFFNNAAGSTEGQMAKNSRVTINFADESYYYYFRANGKAYRNEIVNGVLYGGDGKRIQSDAGWMAVTLEDPVTYTVNKVRYTVSGTVAVNGSGRVRTTDGSSVRIDGENFTVHFKLEPSGDGETGTVSASVG